MRLVIYILAVLFVAIAVTMFAIDDPGYVLLVRPPWSIELPLTLFSVFAFVAFIGLYISGRVLGQALRLPRGFDIWRKRRLGHKARTAMTQGLVYLAAGQWNEAESELLDGLPFSEAPMVTYLALALSAQGQGNKSKRDDYLLKANEEANEDTLAVGMTQGLLQYMARQKEQALATLTELYNQQPNHKYVLKLLMETYIDLTDWTGLANLLPDLHKNKVLDEDELKKLELRVHRELLKLSLPTGSLNVLRQAWKAMPKHLHQHAELIAIYSGKLIEQGEGDDAESLLRVALERQWDEALVTLYGLAHATQIVRQYERAKSWQTTHADSPALYLTLGRLALETGAADEAIETLQRSLDLLPSRSAYRELGRVYELTGNFEAATTSFRRGLETEQA
ncbi:MAG: heme biosynthesis HemY N-terminal domain-containing protein [Acidiferrobacterales bacterium]